MLITKNVKGYCVSVGTSVTEALAKIDENKSGLVFVVDESNRLLGCLTDGDFRRQLITRESFEPSNVAVEKICNTDCKVLSVSTSRVEIRASMSDRITAIPLCDDSGHLKEVALAGLDGFFLGEKLVSDSSQSLIIAEIGNNHQGDVATAKLLVDAAVYAGACCAKFQMRTMEELYTERSGNDLSVEYTKDLLSKFQLNTSELLKVFDYCHFKGIEPLCTPWDLESLAILEQYGIAGYKIASADLTNHELIAAAVATGKPILCSTGMSTDAEITQTVQLLERSAAEYALLHCNSTYPTPFKDVNLRYMRRLRQITGGFVGYSGHERGVEVPVAAVALGARIIEKHITLDRSLEGNDHKVSLLPDEFVDMVSKIRNVEEAIGFGGSRIITQGEMINRENLAKSIVALRPIAPGETFTRDLFVIRSPGGGLQPMYLEKLIGKRSPRSIERGDFLYESDLSGDRWRPRKYNFDRPIGVPVRYHDYREVTFESSLDFVEFHLSAADLSLSLSGYLDAKSNLDFAVHAPELFSNDHLLDLASLDNDYRQQSKYWLELVIRRARELKLYFPKTVNPVVIINAGGFNSNGFVSENTKALMYENVKKSLSEINSAGVQIAIQTMPPFPWHFGGQSHHNLFVDPSEIAAFANETGVSICLDISHSQMACSYYGWSLIEFVQTVAPYVIHLHISDAKGEDGEGIQIGRGDVNFARLAQVLRNDLPGIQMIPEIWQGHKNSGEGFWQALEYLEQFFYRGQSRHV